MNFDNWNIVWDLGGVLMDWNPEYLFNDHFDSPEEMKFFLEKVCSPEWNYQQDAGRPFEEAIAIKLEEYPNYASEIRMYFEKWIVMIKGSIKKNVDVLSWLKNETNAELYSITNWSAETFPQVRYDYDFFSWFIDIIVSGEEKMVKPNLAIYQLLQRKHDIEPSRTIFIDDNYANAMAPKALGWSAIHYTSDTNLAKAIKDIVRGN